MAMPGNVTSSPLVAALDPRVDEQTVQEQMQEPAAAGEEEVEPDVKRG
jgi:hypothetical protein